jgi:hypothetical protein
MYITGMLLVIRGAFISYQLAVAKLHNARLAVDRLMRDIQSHLCFTPLLCYTYVRAYQSRRARILNESITHTAPSLQND